MEFDNLAQQIIEQTSEKIRIPSNSNSLKAVPYRIGIVYGCVYNEYEATCVEIYGSNIVEAMENYMYNKYKALTRSEVNKLVANGNHQSDIISLRTQYDIIYFIISQENKYFHNLPNLVKQFDDSTISSILKDYTTQNILNVLGVIDLKQKIATKQDNIFNTDFMNELT